MEDMTTTFITGANKGIGYESARRLIEAGHTVLIGARDPERGQAAADQLGARFVQIDVTDDASVTAAAADVAAHEGTVDVLINNAGVSGPFPKAEELTAADAAEVYGVNVIGIVRVTNTFLPLMKESANPVVVNVSSGMGSFEATKDPDDLASSLTAPLYAGSKAAVNMMTTQYATAIPGVKFNAADPGYTSTDFTNFEGHQTVTEGTDAIVELATIGVDGPTGEFRNRDGIVGW